jgi:glycine betaine/proline transport system permease protein
LTTFPADKALFAAVEGWLDAGFVATYEAGRGIFDGIRNGIRILVEGFEVVLMGTPWPVVMLVICTLGWQLAGPRVAIFTAAALAYLGLFGFWELSMLTVALLGAAAILCILIGIPLGIWFARSKRAHTVAQPVLDFMQTMPAFVYLIPVIAFFGTGKPPGIIATLIFGMPPVIRLTTLGLHGVSDEVKEAARAYGATEWQVLRGVELPLAKASILAGINQTILMCLSMVVIASLIGAQGLGSVVLQSLQYAAKGQGLLAGLAILLCAMVIDRIVQGSFHSWK